MMLPPSLLVHSSKGDLVDPQLRASNDTNGPSELARYHLQRVAWIGPNVRASNEALLRARVPRAQGTDQAALLFSNWR